MACSVSLHAKSQHKVLICGIGQNVGNFANNTIKNIEALGERFDDYAVIIYENNSNDSTCDHFTRWKDRNPHVVFFSEKLPPEKIAPSRTEKIACARNCVMSVARGEKYREFDILIWADLDFSGPWPIDEIVRSVELPFEWDCIAANGVDRQGIYYDSFAFRGPSHPVGPELLGDIWWDIAKRNPIKWKGEELVKAFSAFSGLAIYKSKSILPFFYSGVVTPELAKFYQKIFASLPLSNSFLSFYLKMNGIPSTFSEFPIYFRENTLSANQTSNHPEVTCCEHVPLHAAMTNAGFDKFYINPKMVMTYP